MSESLAFPSLDFPNRSSLMRREIANKLRVTTDHVADLIEEGFLAEPAQPAHGSQRSRVSVEGYRKFIIGRTRGRGSLRPPQRLPFPSLEFPSARVLLLSDIAAKLDLSPEHVGEHIITETLWAIDLRGAGASRGLWRVPIEAYRHFISLRIPARSGAG